MQTSRPTTTPRRLSVVLIKPSKYDDDGYVLRYRRGFLPSNTLACLAALTEDVRRKGTLGADLEWEIELLDDTVQDIQVDAIARRARRPGRRLVVGLAGVQTNQFPRAADLALAFRQKGVDVLVGGFHVSGSMAMLASTPPEIQALLEAGVSIVLGEVEGRWGDILGDALRGTLSPVYNFLSEPPDLQHAPIPAASPRYLRYFVTSNFGTLDAGRGCPFHCSFCTIINVQGHRMRYRDVDLLIAGIRENYRRGISVYFITDDNFARNPKWEAILDGLIRLREEEQIPLKFMMQVDALSYRIKDFVQKARRAGCSQVFIGLESLNPKNLAAAGKTHNQVDDLGRLISAFHAERINTHAAYIIGFPFDTPASVREDIERLKQLGVKQASFFMLAPLPGSRDHRECVDRNLPLNPDLNQYDTFHPTFPHPQMSPAEWTGAYHEAWRSFYSFDNMRQILQATPPERYWSVFKNFIWAKSAVFVEHQHPMVAGYFRRKDRHCRRPGSAPEPWWTHRRRVWAETWRKTRAWISLLLEMEDLWLQTRTRRPRPHFSHRLLDSRASLRLFWQQTRADLRRGRLDRLRPIKLLRHFVREFTLGIRFIAAMFATGIR